jgi:hypothetical protein
MTDKTIYWNGATGKRGPDELIVRDLITELTDSVLKLSEAQDYMRRQIDVMKAQIERLERWKGETILQAMTDDAERMGLYEDFSNPLKKG